jgi:hypothetical protein
LEKVDEEIERYCQIFEKVRDRLSKASGDFGDEVALKIFEEVVKDVRRGQRKGGKDARATEKQREALQRFGVKRVPDSLTVQEASKILNGLISLSKKSDRASLEKTVEELNKSWA